MKLNWGDFASVLGEAEDSPRFTSVLFRIGERPIRQQDTKEYNDPIGSTKYYKYPASGMEFGFRQGRLNHIHFFIHADEGYSPYTGPLPQGVLADGSEDSVVKAWGDPMKTGGAKTSALLGYIHRWIKYEVEGGHFIRFEFSQEQKLRRLTVMLS